VKNNLDTSIVNYVINKYFKHYAEKYYDDLYSYGLEGLYNADKFYDPTKTQHDFKYFATCVIRRAMSLFIRDKLTKTQTNTTYTDKNEFLDEHNCIIMPPESWLDLYAELNKLPDKHKTFIYYHYYLGYTFEETSIFMKTSIRTLFRLNKKILEKLKENLI
jgi:RNA polymerase sigma factor (sigma-70 family)